MERVSDEKVMVEISVCPACGKYHKMAFVAMTQAAYKNGEEYWFRAMCPRTQRTLYVNDWDVTI